MTNYDAINLINNEILCIQSTKCKREECARCNLVMPEDDILEALSMAIYALKKTGAVEAYLKPVGVSDEGIVTYDRFCPSCGHRIDEEDYCPNCGQAIYWE